jgi:hypothetical protein
MQEFSPEFLCLEIECEGEKRERVCVTVSAIRSPLSHCESPSPLTSFLPSQVQYFAVLCCPLLRTLLPHTHPQPTHPLSRCTILPILITTCVTDTPTCTHPLTHTCVCVCLWRERERESLDKKILPCSCPVARQAAAQKQFSHSYYQATLLYISFPTIYVHPQTRKDLREEKKTHIGQLFQVLFHLTLCEHCAFFQPTNLQIIHTGIFYPKSTLLPACAHSSHPNNQTYSLYSFQYSTTSQKSRHHWSYKPRESYSVSPSHPSVPTTT